MDSIPEPRFADGQTEAQGGEGTGTGVARKSMTKVNLSQEARFLLLPDSLVPNSLFFFFLGKPAVRGSHPVTD